MRQWCVLRLVCVACLAAMGGCRATSAIFQPKGDAAGARQGPDPRQVQGATMSFADRYMTATSDVYDRVRESAPTPAVALEANRAKIRAATGALSNAVNPNPVAGLMDMAIMATLTRENAESAWAGETFGAENAAAIAVVLKAQETDIWDITAVYLKPEQVEELRGLAERWRREHPDQRYVADVRLADFPEAAPSGSGGRVAIPLANSVLALISLDPFTGLDPAVREVEQSRVLAERMFFYAQRMPVLLAWQADGLSMQFLDEPGITRLLDDTNTVAANTTQFTDAAARFADAGVELAGTVERFRADLPAQQAQLVSQLDALIAKERDAALRQAAEEIAAERDAALKQAAAEVSALRRHPEAGRGRGQRPARRGGRATGLRGQHAAGPAGGASPGSLGSLHRPGLPAGAVSSIDRRGGGARRDPGLARGGGRDGAPPPVARQRARIRLRG